MNRPYHLDAEAIARRLNPSARRSPSGWWGTAGHLLTTAGTAPTSESATTVAATAPTSSRSSAGPDATGIPSGAPSRAPPDGGSGDSAWMTPLPHVPPAATQNRETPRDRTEYPRQLWAASFRIEQDPDHPVRRWVARRGLYWPAPVPLPSCIRWLPAGLLSQQHQGAGAIVAAFAPHDEWAERWPYLPNPTCIELVHLDAEGLPALDKPAEEGGLGKRSYGIRQGAVCLLGDPRPESAVGLVIVEGLSDALALASRSPETAAAVGGVSGLQADRLMDWLSRWSSVTVYADDDPDGVDSARRLRRLLAHRGLETSVYTLAGEHNDPGDYAADNPLEDVDMDAAREFAQDLVQEGLPRWEAARLAMMAVGPLPDSDVMSTTTAS